MEEKLKAKIRIDGDIRARFIHSSLHDLDKTLYLKSISFVKDFQYCLAVLYAVDQALCPLCELPDALSVA